MKTNISTCRIGVGFCDDQAPLDRMLGWDQGSWGFHADDGHVFTNDGDGTKYTDPYTAGDVIGCGVNFGEGIAFFTKNGEVIGESREASSVHPASCPAGRVLTGVVRESIRRHLWETIPGCVHQYMPSGVEDLGHIPWSDGRLARFHVQGTVRWWRDDDGAGSGAV